MLRKLTEDSDDYVRLIAGASYARTPQRELGVIRRLLKDKTLRVKAHTISALAAQAGEPELALLREHLARRASQQ